MGGRGWDVRRGDENAFTEKAKNEEKLKQRTTEINILPQVGKQNSNVTVGFDSQTWTRQGNNGLKFCK